MADNRARQKAFQYCVLFELARNWGELDRQKDQGKRCEEPSEFYNAILSCFDFLAKLRLERHTTSELVLENDVGWAAQQLKLAGCLRK